MSMVGAQIKDIKTEKKPNSVLNKSKVTLSKLLFC